MNTEVFPIRISVLSDPFDPVCSGHLDACRAALSAGRADMVLLVLSGDPGSCAASSEDRWRMLVTACAGNKLMLPLRVPPKRESSGAESILRYLRKKYPASNIVAIDYDPGASEVNQLNRIKLMLSTANKNLAKKKAQENNKAV